MEKRLISWQEIEALSDKLAEKIVADCQDLTQVILVAVARGALVPVQIIAYKLGIRDIRVMKLSSYNEDNRHDKIRDMTTDCLFDGINVYVIDDVADSGATLKYIRTSLPNARVCTLLEKRCCEEHPDICAQKDIDKDVWIVFPWD